MSRTRPVSVDGAPLHASWHTPAPDRHYPVVGLAAPSTSRRIRAALSCATWADRWSLALVVVAILTMVIL